MKSTLNIVMVFFLMIFLIFIVHVSGNSPEQVSERDSLKEYLSRPALYLPVGQADANTILSYLDRNTLVKDPTVSAQSVVIWDINNDLVFFSKESNFKRPIASITKLMTAAVVLDRVQPEEEVEISFSSVESEGDAGSLMPGETLDVQTLLHAMLMESSNDAATVLAEYVGGKYSDDTSKTSVKKFVSFMNQKAEEWLLINSYYTDPAGLNDTTSFSTAHDVAFLIKNLRSDLKYGLIWQILKKEKVVFNSMDSNIEHTFTNNNPFIIDLKQSIGGKTGYTEKAGESLVLLIGSPDGESEIAYVLLGSEDRFLDMRTLINWVNSAYVWEK
jgi:D-alanyl-D-alanine carboxypeptidase